MRMIALCLLMTVFGSEMLSAKPALPFRAPQIADLSFGLFCAISVTGRSEAAGTASGWIHNLDDSPAFHWPGQRTVPAVLGLAFGVRAATQPGIVYSSAEMRVYRPGSTAPDIWPTGFNDSAASLAFFRFDTEQELIPGPWVFEAWAGDTQLYRVEFEVVPATTGDPITQACNGSA